ncbi:MAG: hypothetical protein E6G56_04960 [Actinobacteria bacterium]|nr:MAG: hypothetical protein E6G56_04960 [Actinomycetota bacterium]
MSRRSATLIAAVSALALTIPLGGASALAAKRHRINVHHSKLTWATINLCNTKAHPHTVGVRASMPGTGVRSERMLMSFRVQYRDAKGRWLFVPGLASPWRDVGSAAVRVRQSGFDFPFTRPPDGSPTLVRGAVRLEWRRHGRAVATVRIHTTAGHSPAAGADPPGYSAGTCRL